MLIKVYFKPQGYIFKNTWEGGMAEGNNKVCGKNLPGEKERKS